MTECTRIFEWDCAHRLLGHTGKCSNIHGHRYVAEITVSSQKTDRLGMVIDFADLKNLIGSWFDNNWDHSLLLMEGDPLLDALFGQCLRIFVCPSNPTAEWMASYLRGNLGGLLPSHVIVAKVRVYETPNCYAEA